MMPFRRLKSLFRLVIPMVGLEQLLLNNETAENNHNSFLYRSCKTHNHATLTASTRRLLTIKKRNLHSKFRLYPLTLAMMH